jgi:hypothetical protein
MTVRHAVDALVQVRVQMLWGAAAVAGTVLVYVSGPPSMYPGKMQQPPAFGSFL